MARYVRVTSVSYGGAGGPEAVERARAEGVEWLERAALDRPDIVCLPETFTGLGRSGEEWFRSAEMVPGPTTEALGAVARRHRMYVICPILERRGDRVFNAAVLLGRDGTVLGAYDKVHPTISEIELGVTPGTAYPVFELEFGRIGCAICYDLNFRDVAEGLLRNGAEILFFPSMYRGGLQLRIWAHDFACFLLSATPGEGSALVDPLGRVQVESSKYQPLFSRVINLDRALLHIDANDRHWDAIKRKYGAGIELDVASPEAVFALISHLPDVTADDVVREYGLERRDDYFARANRVRAAALERAGRTS
jgi:predicted amidohydrolase